MRPAEETIIAKCKSKSGRDLVNSPSGGRLISGGLIAILILCHRVTGLWGARGVWPCPLLLDKEAPEVTFSVDCNVPGQSVCIWLWKGQQSLGLEMVYSLPSFAV